MILVVSKKGKVLGGSKCTGVPYIEELIQKEVGRHIDDMLNERLLSILSTKENVNLETLGLSQEASRRLSGYYNSNRYRRRDDSAHYSSY